jgi:DNA-binding transcriptional ArsR family regulator
MPKKPAPGLAATLEEIRDRLAKLEAASRTAPAATGFDTEKYWLLDRVARGGAKGGEVVYGGLVTVPTGEQYAWQKHAGAKELFARDWSAVDRVLAALGHPVRLAILKALLEGKRAKAELERIEGLGTTGQLYHHLKALEEAGWVRTLERGIYGVPGERVVPLLAILSAAAG